MAEYCTQPQVETRLRVGGAAYILDGNPDFIEQAISDAGAEIDAAICDQIDPDAARGQSNDFLRKCCVDLAVMRCFGGDDIPDSFASEAELTRAALRRIESGNKIPRLTYPGQPSGDPRYDVSSSLPSVVNPCVHPGRGW